MSKPALSGRSAGETDLPHVARLITLGELSASIAHELSQPLAAIVLNGEANLRWFDHSPPDVPNARAGVAAMLDSARRAGKIIDRLRALSRKSPPEKVELALNTVISDVIPLVQLEANSRQVCLQLDLACPSPRVVGDRIQLQQVVINLLLNGIQAMASTHGRARELLIGSRQELNEAVVTVQDTGAGFAPLTMDRVFEPFFTTRDDGVGIGLSVCRMIIEAHDGRIWASCNRGHGATFHFALPRH